MRGGQRGDRGRYYVCDSHPLVLEQKKVSQESAVDAVVKSASL